MDLSVLNLSVFSLPSSHRVGAIVHDGAQDLKLWPGPGRDRDLLEAYGPELRDVLDKVRKRDAELGLGQLVRLHPGRLHCDLLLWIATRPPEPGATQATAPSLAAIAEATVEALRFAAERNVLRVAFPALGVGLEPAGLADRLVCLAKAAQGYQEECFQRGKAPVVEEVLICDPNSAAVAAARRALGGTIRPPRAESDREPAVVRKKQGSPKTPRARSRGRSARLDPDELARARLAAAPYDRARLYQSGEWMIHPHFGAGRVDHARPEGGIVVLFEDGRSRTMVHGS